LHLIILSRFYCGLLSNNLYFNFLNMFCPVSNKTFSIEKLYIKLLESSWCGRTKGNNINKTFIGEKLLFKLSKSKTAFGLVYVKRILISITL